jgi:hypothetical protein
MYDDFQQQYERFFADHVEELFEQSRANGIKGHGAVNLKYYVLEAPYIKLIYSAVDDEIIARLKPMVCAALAWQVQFRKTKPSGAPELPINYDDCERLRGSRSSRMRRVGEFGYSLWMSQWHPEHPEFADYCREVKAGGYWRHDEMLQRCEQFFKRIDAGILNRGVVPKVEQPHRT